MATKLGPVPLLVLLISSSSALRVIDTGLGHNWQAVSDDKLIKDFAVLSEGDNNATLPSDLTICASMSTSDARNPAVLFQLLSDEYVPWINICILFAVKTAKVHKIKAQVSWFFSVILYEVHKGLSRTPSFLCTCLSMYKQIWVNANILINQEHIISSISYRVIFFTGNPLKCLSMENLG